MNEGIIKNRNAVISFLYRNVAKPFFFKFDPEVIHDSMIFSGKTLGKSSMMVDSLKMFFDYKNSILHQKVLGIYFENPVGLSAGFDKNAELTSMIHSIGFGFAEIGSITAKPCAGNPKPRLWRLKESKGIVVYYGLANKGIDIISEKIKESKNKIPLGMSVAMTNCEDNVDYQKAITDYKYTFAKCIDVGDYVTINVSCPNAQGGQPFADPQKLDALLTELDKIKINKPVFIKLSPDLSDDGLDATIVVLDKHNVQGIICTNLTKHREDLVLTETNVSPKGGISGKPLQPKTDRLLAKIYQKTKGKYILVGVGGIFNAEDAYKKIRLGATLLQMVTGVIFEGPQVVSEINLELAGFLKRDGFKNISEAIGIDNTLA